ncbi:LPXTG cell wall anchor domain-containing protein [Streptomyces sp. NPDC059575]|uniref:LPXTG cell wall anchor domain-containing protein n=1 Tax=Streptomyces sp. NPDC059575 TaxID=3346872 RepID=UPI0036A144AC
MKLRRSLALAAATAAITPAVLLAAPVAYASDEVPAATSSESTSTSTEESQTTTVTTPGTEETTAGTEETTPGNEETTAGTEETTSGTDKTAPDTKASTPAADASKSTDASPTKPGASPSPSASESSFPTECDTDTPPKFDDKLSTGLSGLPSKIVAGSGFHNFKMNVKNSGTHTYKRVDLGVFAMTMSESEDDFSTDNYLTLQYKDPSTGTWTDISTDEDDDAQGYLGYTDIQAKESFSIDLRLAVDAKAPAGFGFAMSIGMYADDKGDCFQAGDENFYDFDVLKAGAAPGKPTEAKPQGGRKPLPAKPSGNTQISPQGHLAETGASSVLPLFALSGGAAVALGAGAVFAVRRRKGAGSGIVA